MRSVLLASLRMHTRRYVAALVAVAIAVAFVVVIDAIGSGARSAVASGVEAAYPQADLVVGEDYGLTDTDPTNALAVARERGDRASVLGSAWAPVEGPEGSLGDDVRIGTVSLDPELRSQEIVDGRAPTGPEEALMTGSAARSAGVEPGDRLTIGTGAVARTVTVVGLSGPPSYVDGDVQVTWPMMTEIDGAIPASIAYDVRSDDLETAQEVLAAAVDSEVRTRDDFVDAQIVMRNNGVDVLSMLLLLFAAVAGFVAVLVIANTFTILFAQRSRDFALLRCVGATRRQVLRSVRVEALVLALVAGVTGVVAGVASGFALGALVRAVAGEENFGTVSHSPVWLTAAFVGGIATTVVAAWFPTRAVVRVSPLAALRPAEQPGGRTTSGRVRIGFGALVAAGGGAALVLAAITTSMELMLLGGMTSFVGVLLLGPVLVPALLRLVGRVAGRWGGPLPVAAANAVRNPRRSAATTASLLVGVTLATAVLTGMTSARQAVTAEMNAENPVDFAISASEPIAEKTIDRVRAVKGVATVLPLTGVSATSEVGEIRLIGPRDADRVRTLDAAMVRAEQDEILVPMSLASTLETGLPDRLTLRTPDGSVTLASRLVAASWGQAAIVPAPVLDRLTDDASARVLWVLADDGADADELAGTLGAMTRGADLTDNLSDQQWVATQLDVLVWAVLGLLGVGIVIALVGIANTVGLSILERSREHALLRALGLTRSGLRRMLAAEGMLLALVAAVMGTGLGVLYAWFGVRTVVEPVMDAGLVVPWAQLAAVVVVASLAGLAASTLPARRGARVTPAEGLTLN